MAPSALVPHHALISLQVRLTTKDGVRDAVILQRESGLSDSSSVLSLFW